MSHDIQSRKGWSRSYEDGKWGLLRFPFVRPTDKGFEASIARQVYERNSYPKFDPLKQNQEFTFDPKCDSMTMLDLSMPDGCHYGELTFSGSDNDYVRDAAGMLKQIAGGSPELEEFGFTPFVRDPLTHEVLFRGESYYVLYGDWIGEDRVGKAIMIPARFIFPNGRDMLTLQELLGIKLHIRVPEDRLKIRKYFKRFKAPHVWAARGEFGKCERVTVCDKLSGPANLLGGEVVTTRSKIMGDALEVQFGSVKATWLFIDIDQFGPDELSASDGVNPVEIKFLHALGEELDNDELRRMRVGDAFKWTCAASDYFGKGLCHAVDTKGGPYQAIIYGPKRQMEFDHAYVGSMGDIGELDNASAFTEVQSINCFATAATMQLWIELEKIHLQMVETGLYDEEMLRYLFLAHIAPLADMLEDPDLDAEIWGLLEAIRNGVPLLRHPALMQKVINHLLKTVNQQVRGRIPYGDKAYLGYFQPDWDMFDFHTGNVDVSRSRIGVNEVCCPDAPAGQTIVIYRRPIGNNQEAIFAVNIGADEMRHYRKFKGRGRIILGRGVRKQLKTAGGADGDDQAVVVTDLAWVEAFQSVPKYPVAEMPADIEEALTEDDDEYFVGFNDEYEDVDISQGPVDAKEWVIAHCWEACDNALALAITIGMVSNVNTLDQQLSGDSKANMLRAMARQIEKLRLLPKRTQRQQAQLEFGLKCFAWLESRTPYQCSVIASNLEAFIDNIKLGKGNAVMLRKLWVNAMVVSNESLVYPRCWKWMGLSVEKGGRGTRIPAKRLAAGDYALAPSLLDEILQKIAQDIDQLYARFDAVKWSGSKPIPNRLNRVFPRNKAIRELAEELFLTWNGVWKQFLSGQINTYKTEVDTNIREIILFGGTVYLVNGTSYVLDGVRTRFREMTINETGHQDEVMQSAIAVEIARLSYTGAAYQVDGLLWTDFMARCYVRALRLAGLTGLYVPVKLDRHHGDLRTISKRLLLKESLERARLRKEGKTSELPADCSMKVKVILGTVMRLSDGSLVGTALGDIPDGEYVMIDNLIEVKPAHPELTGKPVMAQKATDSTVSPD